MDIDLEDLERLHKTATPGPWVANNWGRVWYTPNPDSKRLVCDTMRNTVKNPKSWRANARLIAAMREALPELIAENRALREKVRELEAQRDFVLMHRMPSECLSPKDCVYLAGESPDWRCTAKREMRKKCLEKAVARAEGETGKTADVDAEQAAKEAGE